MEKSRLPERAFSFRKIIGSGDDMTFICNGRFVLDYVQAYLNAVQDYKKNHPACRWNYSSCAGICIFHSHYPFSLAYSVSEQACDDGAKRQVHLVDKQNERPVAVEQGWFDFHFIHSGIGGNLEEIRSSQGTEKCIARPWLISWNADDTKAENAVLHYKSC